MFDYSKKLPKKLEPGSLKPNKFSKWDPLKGKPPEYCHDEFLEVCRRARNILKPKKSKLIIQLLLNVEEAIEKVDYEDTISMMESKELKSDFILTRKSMRHARKAGFFSGPLNKQFTWPQHYAVLALSYVASAIPSLKMDALNKELLGLTDQENKERHEKFAHSMLNNAVDLIDAAEEIEEERQLAIRGSKSKVLPTDKIKYEFIVFHSSRPDKTLRTNALNYYKSRTDKSIKLRNESPENIYRFCYKAWKAYSIDTLLLPDNYLSKL